MQISSFSTRRIAPRYRPLAWASVVVAGIAVLFVLNASRIERQLDAWKLLPKTQALTELYASEGRPTHYTPDTPQIITFTIHNFEGRSRDYHYSVIARGPDNTRAGDTTRIVTSGSIKLANGERRTVTVPVVISNQGPRVHLGIVLSDGPSIGYWLERKDS